MITRKTPALDTMCCVINKLRFAILMIITTFCFVQSSVCQKTYGIFEKSTGVLTLGYNNTLPENTIEINSNKNDDWIANEIINASEVKKILIDKSFANFLPTSCSNWFFCCNQLTEIEGLNNINTENVTDMSYMFCGCNNISVLDLGSFNTKNVLNMDGMFSVCTHLKTIYVSNQWSTLSVKNSEGMFYGCEMLFGEMGTEYTPIKDSHQYAKIDMGNENPGYFTRKGNNPFEPKYEGIRPYAVLNDGVLTFYYDDNYPNNSYQMPKSIPTWREDNIITVVFDKSFKNYTPTSCSGWLGNLNSLIEIKGMEYLNTINVTDMSYFFAWCNNLKYLDLSHLDTKNVTDMNYMFAGCEKLESLDLLNFNTDKVTNMSGMFFMCQNITNLELSSFNTSNVTNMQDMFLRCTNLRNLNLSTFKTDNVINMNNMFSRCEKLESLDLSNFNTGKVTNMVNMFALCPSLKTIYVGDQWSTKAVIEGNAMFVGSTSLVGGEGTIFDEQNCDATYACIDNGINHPGYFSMSDKYKNHETSISVFTQEDDLVTVFGISKAIIIETLPDTKYTIIDLSGRTIKSATTKSSREEISISKSGIFIVIMGGKTYKVNVE